MDILEALDSKLQDLEKASETFSDMDFRSARDILLSILNNNKADFIGVEQSMEFILEQADELLELTADKKLKNAVSKLEKLAKETRAEFENIVNITKKVKRN